MVRTSTKHGNLVQGTSAIRSIEWSCKDLHPGARIKVEICPIISTLPVFGVQHRNARRCPYFSMVPKQGVDYTMKSDSVSVKSHCIVITPTQVCQVGVVWAKPDERVRMCVALRLRASVCL